MSWVTDCALWEGVLTPSQVPTPTVLGSVVDAMLANSQGVAVSGDLCVVTVPAGDRVVCIDVSNPASPSILGSLVDATNLNGAFGVAIVGSHAFVAARDGNRITSVDISTPATPTVASSVGSGTGASGPLRLRVSGSHAFAACSTGSRITAVNISNPASLGAATPLFHANLSGAQGIDISGTTAFVTTTGNRITAINISNPAAMTHISSLQDNTNLDDPIDLAVVGNYAYLTVEDIGEVAVVNVTNTASMSFVVDVDTAQLVGSQAIDSLSSGEYVVVGTSGNIVAVVDITVPGSSTQIGYVDDATNLPTLRGLAVSAGDDYVYCACNGRFTVVGL